MYREGGPPSGGGGVVCAVGGGGACAGGLGGRGDGCGGGARGRAGARRAGAAAGAAGFAARRASAVVARAAEGEGAAAAEPAAAPVAAEPAAKAAAPAKGTVRKKGGFDKDQWNNYKGALDDIQKRKGNPATPRPKAGTRKVKFARRGPSDGNRRTHADYMAAKRKAQGGQVQVGSSEMFSTFSADQKYVEEKLGWVSGKGWSGQAGDPSNDSLNGFFFFGLVCIGLAFASVQ